VVGAADALDEARRALRRAHLDDQIDVAPVDAEIEAGGADERAQPAEATAASTLRRASSESEP
jgi:hypothetical protein